MTKRGHQPPQPNSGEPPTPSSYSNGYEDYPRTPARPSSYASLKGCCWCLVLLLLFVALPVLLIFLAVKAKKKLLIKAHACRGYYRLALLKSAMQEK
jgi:hypothetical protein